MTKKQNRNPKKTRAEGSFLRIPYGSVPLRRSFEMDLDGLLGIGDVKPPPVIMPAFGNHLNEDAAHGRVRNVRHSVAVCLHIEFQLLVFPDLALFDVFEVNAGVFNGRLFVAAGDFDGDARLGIGFRHSRLRSGG